MNKHNYRIYAVNIGFNYRILKFYPFFAVKSVANRLIFAVNKGSVYRTV